MDITKQIRYSEEKDKILQKIRKISFNTIVRALKKNRVIKVLNHPNQKKFPNQQLMLIRIRNYIYVVPFVETETEIFLKTIYKSRKYTKLLNNNI